MTVLHRSGASPTPSSVPSGGSWTRPHSTESSPGSSRGRSGSRSESDLLSTASSALRRLHFKSSASRRYRGKATSAQVPPAQPIPTVVIMGSSTTSETTINTSTDSATTQVTAVTATDGETTEDSLDRGDALHRTRGKTKTNPRQVNHPVDDILGLSSPPMSLDKGDEDVFIKDTAECKQEVKRPTGISTEFRETIRTSNMSSSSQTSVVAGPSGTSGQQLQSTPTTPLLSAFQRKSGDQNFIFTRTEIEDDGEDFLADPSSPTWLASTNSKSQTKPSTSRKSSSSSQVLATTSNLNDTHSHLATKTPPNSPLTKSTSPQHQPHHQPHHHNHYHHHYTKRKHVNRKNGSSDRRHSHYQPPPSPTLSVRAAQNTRRMSDQPYASKDFFLNGRHSSQDSDTELRPIRKEPAEDKQSSPKKNGPSSRRASTSHTSSSRTKLNADPPPQRRKSSSASTGGTTPKKRDNVHRKASATIVVQQPSVTGNSPEGTGYSIDDASADYRGVEANVLVIDKQKQRERNMRQLLDVTNAVTQQQMHDFEMRRYGSPHHARSQSVKTPGRSSNVSDRARPHLLCLPQQRARVASMPNTGVEEEYYRLRHFSITGKGVVNRGDSLKSRRSRSKNSVASSNSSHSSDDTETVLGMTDSSNSSSDQDKTLVDALDLAGAEQAGPERGGGGGGGREGGATSHPGSARSSATCSLASSRDSSTCTQPYRVIMLGGAGVGKSSIVQQFMTSEYLHAYDLSLDDECGEKSVSVLLDGEESELTFVENSCSDTTPMSLSGQNDPDPHAYCVVYSQSDLCSFRHAEAELQRLWTSDSIGSKAVILVANKTDLVRSRAVTPEEGKAAATSYDCKFIETSVAINHNVDELLVGLLTQIRLKLQDPERTKSIFRKRSLSRSKSRSKSPLIVSCVGGLTSSCVTSDDNNGNGNNTGDGPPGPGFSPKCRRNRMSASLKVRGLLGKVWARDSKSKSCENLHVL